MNCESVVVEVVTAACGGDAGSGTAAAAVAVGVGTILEVGSGAFDAVDARVGGNDDSISLLLLLLPPGVNTCLESQSGTCGYVSKRHGFRGPNSTGPRSKFVHHH